MMAYCSRSEHCVFDVMEKLSAAAVSEDDANEIVQELIRLGYIDELRYARAFVNDKFRFNKWGKIKIAHALRQKKVASNVIQDALDTIDDEAYNQVLMQLIESKKKTTKATATQQRAAVMRFALSRGFEYETIMRLLR
ncbi:MAG: RecX family transcriptional regulator [Paludibacteraceae bacterium]|nr:RecX family transcriptional regulator [Paludibacteraceae bacterium]